MQRTWTWIVAALAAGGCAANEADFRPVGAEADVAPELAAAYYELKAEGQQLGDAKVWSMGAHTRKDDEGVERTWIRLGIRLRNDTDQPMTLDLERTQLELQPEKESGTLVAPEPATVEGEVEVAPRSLERIELSFLLTNEVDANDIAALELVWVVQTAVGQVSEATPFQRIYRRGRSYYRPYYHSPYYDPWLYDPWWPHTRWGFYGAGPLYRW